MRRELSIGKKVNSIGLYMCLRLHHKNDKVLQFLKKTAVTYLLKTSKINKQTAASSDRHHCPGE